MAKITAIKVFKSAVVVDKTAINRLTTEKMAEAMNSAYSEGKPVLFIDNSALFFTKKNLISSLTERPEHLNVLLEHFSLALSQEEENTVKAFISVRDSIVSQINKVKTDYPFQSVPDNFDFDRTFSIKSMRVRRNTYRMGLVTAKRIWEKASLCWVKSGVVANNKYYTMGISAEGYHRNAIIYGDRVEIGCQTIPRYEVEQLAQHMNWDFPSE